jgi:hypothetical protein
VSPQVVAAAKLANRVTFREVSLAAAAVAGLAVLMAMLTAPAIRELFLAPAWPAES